MPFDMKKEDLLKVLYRLPSTSFLGRIMNNLFNVEISRFKIGYFHTFSHFSSDNKYHKVVIEKTNGQVILVPNDKKYWIKND